jgi:hypothetical protein
MRPLLLWVTTAVLGLAAALLIGVGGTVGAAFFVLVIPLVLRGPMLVALSGLLTGFGGAWLFMIERQFASGGRLDNADVWWALGLVTLVLGLALTVAVLAYQARNLRAP